MILLNILSFFLAHALFKQYWGTFDEVGGLLELEKLDVQLSHVKV